VSMGNLLASPSGDEGAGWDAPQNPGEEDERETEERPQLGEGGPDVGAVEEPPQQGPLGGVPAAQQQQQALQIVDITVPTPGAAQMQLVPFGNFVEFVAEAAHEDGPNNGPVAPPPPNIPLDDGEEELWAQERETEGKRIVEEHVEGLLASEKFSDCSFEWPPSSSSRPVPAHKIILGRALRFRSDELGAATIPDCIPVPPSVSRPELLLALKRLYSTQRAEEESDGQGDEESVFLQSIAPACPLLEHLESFVGRGELSDARVALPGGTFVSVHRAVVCARCFFRGALCPDAGMMESSSGELDLTEMFGVTPEGFLTVLHYVYAGNREHLVGAEASRAMLSAHALSMCDAVDVSAKWLEEGVRDGRVECGDVPKLLYIADHCDAGRLRYACVQACVDALEVIRSLEGFESLPTNIQREVDMLQRAEKAMMMGSSHGGDMRVGCGKELLGMLKESVAQQRERLAEAVRGKNVAFTIGGSVEMETHERTEELLLRQDRRLRALEEFVTSHQGLFAPPSLGDLEAGVVSGRTGQP